MNILRYSVYRVPWGVKPFGAIYGMNPIMHFSHYFKQKDQTDIYEYQQYRVRNKKYRGLLALWQKPLQKKRLRQARIKQIKANLQEPKPEIQKFIVHNPALGIKAPPAPQNIFAVIKIDGKQMKVTNDCVILLDTKPDHQINKNITFQEVLLLGTDTYTLLGRPIVNCAKVSATIESISQTQKIIVFKKKRRKQYKRSFGSRVSLTSIRINNIVHTLTEQLLSRAVTL